MDFIWKGLYKGGELEIRAPSLEEVDQQIDIVRKRTEGTTLLRSMGSPSQIPQLEGVNGCSEAVRTALSSGWGGRPRTMAEFDEVFEQNALFFGAGTLSGVLNHLTRSGQVRRLERNGKWAYTLSKKGDNDHE